VKITFFGAAKTVTGSCYLVEHDSARFLVDCGLYQGSKELKERNYAPFPFNPAEISFLLLTHAHIDHSGLIPKLYKFGFKGPVYTTAGTLDLSGVMLPDCGHIQEMEVEQKNRKGMRSGKALLQPIYTAMEAIDCQRYFKAVEYNMSFSPAPGIEVVFKDAGHILGSSMLEISYHNGGGNEKLVFTGDLGRYNHYLVNDPETIAEADYLVMESTYGNRAHEDQSADKEKFSRIINESFQRGGNVIIPAFAVDRTQTILMMLSAMLDAGQIKPGCIYLDSPLAIQATEIFCKYPQYFDEETTKIYKKKGHCPLEIEKLVFSHTAEDSMALNNIKRGAIIISASGMADAGRIKHHLKHNLWRPECSVIFMGYQAEGTLGRRILDGNKFVRIHGEDVTVKAQIYSLTGFSAHADSDEMIKWLHGFKKMPKRIFITHGEEDAAQNFGQLVRTQFATEVVVPSFGDEFHAATGAVLTKQAAQRAEEDKDSVIADICELVKQLEEDGKLPVLEQVREYLKKVI